ncbi:hypothetical protein WMY93_018621 [Mugilogobius chulae]|uniref:Immunoglobulin domain-containing protein n=1 Tax=Mugilogobius chulae TaxID=88201 RepID=A0AAW0NVF5_9GOBI
MMTLFVTLVFICFGLNGVQALNTVSHVAMDFGGTVEIPCQYEENYLDNVKYLCKGSSWGSCKMLFSDKINSAKYSIEDDKVERIITFTIKNLEWSDSEYYWCNIERPGKDYGRQFRLSVTNKGESKLSVDSQLITGYFDDQITIKCKYNGSGLMKWCRVGGDCRTSGKMNGAQVSTNRSVTGVFSVTMSGLTEQNIGWYWFDFGGLQMPVFLEVTERPTTTPTESTSFFSSNQPETTSYIYAAAIALGLLTLIVIVSLLTWFMLKRKVKTTVVEDPASLECAENPVYSNVPRPMLHQV